ncbi:hypothetical protein [Leifsonia sp. 71-9]|uniref:hypothetical protein n=1 Tax=Leifsonia sp. 71-9 TaxID=1895934 RepID=UPI0009296E08|nr:hypothetical protein [Leifsonia sp. 71-9]OJX72814.1 MAG: hypothetical protein BGO91_13675 [Leifsonia sp. 71-9]
MSRIISEGERWTIWDTFDGSVIMQFDSWSDTDPAGRAREAFDSYPRRASLWREQVVKYERELIDSKYVAGEASGGKAEAVHS